VVKNTQLNDPPLRLPRNLKAMKITAEISELEGDELLMLSIPMDKNVSDMNDELVFSRFKDRVLIESNVRKVIEIFNLFKHE
jgi:hypothetical protein